MRSRRIPWNILLMGIALALPSPVALAQEGASNAEVKWRKDYVSARMEAKEKGLPLVIDFGKKDCLYCTKLDLNTFRDPRVTALMNERFVPLKVRFDGSLEEAKLANDLGIGLFPTVVLAGPDGKFLSAPLVGYKDAEEFREHLQRALAAITSPDWMVRDLKLAANSIESGDYVRAIPALRTILDDGRGCPAQLSAEKLMSEMEQKAGERLRKAKDLQDKTQYAEAIDVLRETLRAFPGLKAAKEAADRITRIEQSPEIRKQQRSKRSVELLAQAKDFFKNREFNPCWDRCEVLVSSYGDLPEGVEASLILGDIKNNPEWLQSAVDTMSDRLATLQLALADAQRKKGQPQQAEAQWQRVIQQFPGSRHAEAAQSRLAELQGLPGAPTRRVEIQSATAP